MSPVVSVQSWDDVEEQARGDYKAIPAGVYEAYLKGWEKKISGSAKNKGKEYYSPEFVIDQDDVPKAHVWGYWDTREARGYMKKDLASLGVSLAGVDIDDVEGLEERLDEAIDKPCRLRIRVTTYQGTGEDEETGEEITVVKEKNEIRAILPPR